MKRFQIFPILVIFAALVACDNQRVYEKNIDLPAKSWYLDSTISFTFNIDDINQQYNIYYNIRNTASFPYQNLYVNYTLTDSAGRKLKSNLQNLHLFDSKTGEPFGKGLGDIYDNQIVALKNFKFNYPGKHAIHLQQFMRMDTLPELMSVGIRVEKATE